MPFDGKIELFTSPVVAVLRAAKERIGKPQLWCKNKLASRGRYCAVGAFRFLAENTGRADAACYRFLQRAIGGRSIPHWNDDRTTTHAEVMEAFDKAIALAEQE